MPKYRFVTGRYDSKGKRIKGKTEKATKGKLSTLSGLKYGGSSKKTEQYRNVRGVRNPEKMRKQLIYKGSTKTYAQMTLGRYIKQGKVASVPSFGGKGDHFLTSVIEMAKEVRAPDWMLRKLERMDPDKLYLLGQLERHTVEVYFDYQGMADSSIDEYDLFWSEKWDDVTFLIDQYERAYGVID